jgi:hypothetical protein
VTRADRREAAKDQVSGLSFPSRGWREPSPRPYRAGAMRDSAELQAGTAVTTTSEAPPSRCPVDHRALAAAQAPAETTGCPVMHQPAGDVVRPPADVFMRRLLRIPDHPKKVRERDVQRLFSTSILISAIRCVLSYIVFPILAPTLGAITKVGAAIGIPVGIVALVFDIRAVRRFWLANHKYRWPFTIVYGIVIALVVTLFGRDIANLVA